MNDLQGIGYRISFGSKRNLKQEPIEIDINEEEIELPQGEPYIPSTNELDEEEKELIERADSYRYKPQTKMFELMLDYLGINSLLVDKIVQDGSDDEDEKQFNVFKMMVMNEDINKVNLLELEPES